jgi:putative ABC transport system substrate-binding protein
MLDQGRRHFIGLLGGAAVSVAPLVARAQQPAMPVIGFLNLRSPEGALLRAFRQGLKDTGYVEGENVAIEYRWAEDQTNLLPELAAQLVRRQVAVIAATGGIPAALAAKAATTTIPVLVVVGRDPVALGLVASLARPGGNVTGINFFSVELAAKRLELLREVVPAARRIALLVDPGNPESAAATVRDAESAARALGLEIQVLNAANSREIDAAFSSFARVRPDGVLTGTGVFNSRRVQLAQWTTLHRIPAIYTGRQYTEVGGLMSYGTSLSDAYRQIGLYAGRILKGAKPVDLPVVQSTKFELIINAQTARILDLKIPPSLIARADEVIE